MVRLVTDESILVIPSDAIQIQQAILSELHGSALGGHLGWQKMDVFTERRVLLAIDKQRF